MINVNWSPLTLLKVSTEYVVDSNRLKKANRDQIKKIKDKNFRNIVKYAYNIPLYNRKYKKASVSPDDVKTIEDIEKLPVITRKDLIENFPDGILPENSKNLFVVNTSGSTRYPVSYYTDSYTIMKSLILYARQLQYYGARWNKSKITIIANFYSQTGPTRMFDSGVSPTIGSFTSLNNIQQINADDNLVDIIKKIDRFKPEYIIGFPGPIRHLALLKMKGYGKNVKPKCFMSSGGIFGNYEKKEVEETFGVKVYDLYGSTEGGPISFECEHGFLHINSDYLHLESLDKDNNILSKECSGRLALTKLYGYGTPLIRYMGMGDIISLKEGCCDCGLPTDLIKCVHGRIKETIVLPDNKIVYPRAVSDLIGKVMYNLRTNKIDRIQLVQRDINKIDILVIIDEEKREIGCPVEKLFNELENNFSNLFGKNIFIDIKDVKKLESEDKNEESTPGILTKINAEEYIV